MTPRFHGGDLHHIKQTYPDAHTPWVDLSTGINPWGYPWMEKLSSERLYQAGNRLPGDNDYERCRQAYARYLNCTTEKLVFGPGSQALLEKLPALFPHSDVYVLGPTYQEHGHSWDRMGHTVHFLPYTAESLSMIPAGKIIQITTPNNPDGATIEPAQLYAFALSYTAKNGILVIDEAFMDLTPENSLINYDLPDGVFVLRSLGKFFGLAGLRLGVLHASPGFCQRMISLSALWNISTLTLEIATTAVADTAWITTTHKTLARQMDRLCDLLKGSGYRLVGRTDLYCFITGDNIPELFYHLAQAGIYTRRFHDRPDHLRFGLPPTEAAFDRLNTLLQDPLL
ncbi:threonine-phosphate decarboxylase [Paremcibacter congregatus]|uniref:threonine-phosphate decarboxylase n=1 Tax=Paremcibacter congregatus TaxID=2043170 RepID=UPI003A8D00CE